MLTPGTPAPPFALPDDEGRTRTLDELTQHGPLMLYFYPADFTPVCTAEACMFRDEHGELLGAGIQLAGISAQSDASHAKFKRRHALSFPLLADDDRSVIKAYEATGLFGLPLRLTYLITPDRVIADAVQANLGVRKHRDFVRRAIESYGQPPVSD